MKISRKTYAEKMDEQTTDRFCSGLRTSGWRREISGDQFSKSRDYWEDICMEKGTIITNELQELVTPILQAMPYLEIMSYEASGGRAIVFHKDSDFPVGFLSVNDSYSLTGRYKVFSPLNQNTRSSGNSTDNLEKALQLARKFFKYIPPLNINAYVVIGDTYSSLVEDYIHKHTKYSRLEYKLRKNNFTGEDESLEVYNFLFKTMQEDPEFITQCPKFFANHRLLENLEAEAKYIPVICSSVSYVRLTKNNKVTYNVSATDFREWRYVPAYKQIRDVVVTDIDKLDERLMVKVSQLMLEEPKEFVDEVGMRVSNNEFLVFTPWEVGQ